VANEAAEGALSLAERLWNAHETACGSPASNHDVLDLIMNKLAS